MPFWPQRAGAAVVALLLLATGLAAPVGAALPGPGARAGDACCLLCGGDVCACDHMAAMAGTGADGAGGEARSLALSAAPSVGAPGCDSCPGVLTGASSPRVEVALAARPELGRPASHRSFLASALRVARSASLATPAAPRGPPVPLS